ncbi:hypothetical protein NKJ09_22775 [Mesorhizobium sp. M0189]|uniref:HK97 family phage prohead protease n=1 Tax=Mesorhizobium sp. M0189 TaxID=2956909 RepID=UPI003334C34F
MAKFRKASADEAQAKRKDHVRDSDRGLVMVKGFKSPPSWNKDTRSARFIMTSESVDRYRDIVVQAGLDIDRFLENPQGLLFHNSRSWPCGLWSDVTKVLSGRPKRTEGNLDFLPEGTDEDADRAARHVAAGSLRTVSIGFKPNWEDIDFILDDDDDWTGGFRYNSSELLECSLVPIPAQPDALVKDAGGDLTLARELIEEILDTYAKTPEGLLVPMDEYRAKHFDLGASRSTFIIDKSLAPAARTFVPAADMELKATTDAEAAAFVGAKVTVNPAHAENKNYPFSDCLDKATGEVIDSWIVPEGENKGVHALAVEFLTDAWSGMFRGIKADRFLLAEKAETPKPAEKWAMPSHLAGKFTPEEDVEFDRIASSDGHEAASAAVAVKNMRFIQPERVLAEVESIRAQYGDDAYAAAMKEWNDHEKMANLPKDDAPEVDLKQAGIDSIVIGLDTTEATEKLNALQRLAESVGATLSRFFGPKVEKEKSVEIEPVETPAPPSAEDIAAAREMATASIQRLVNKGLIQA